MSTNFKIVSNEWDLQTGGERHLREINKNLWISVLHRKTGFGFWEWETAIVRIRDNDDPLKFKRGSWDDREMIVLSGDRRIELNDLNQEEILAYAHTHSGEKNTFDKIMEALGE